MLYNHNSSACLNTFQSRYMAPPDPAGLDEQGRDQQSVHVEAEQEKEQARILLGTALTMSASSARLCRHHRTISKERFES